MSISEKVHAYLLPFVEVFSQGTTTLFQLVKVLFRKPFVKDTDTSLEIISTPL